MPPLKRLPDRSWIRPAYQPAAYTITAKELKRLLGCPFPPAEEMAKRDGMYNNYDRLSEHQIDGKPYVRLFERSQGWIIEVELTETVPPDIRSVAPEEAWLFARTRDMGSDQYVPIEGSPPPGKTDPWPPPSK